MVTFIHSVVTFFMSEIHKKHLFSLWYYDKRSFSVLSKSRLILIGWSMFSYFSKEFLMNIFYTYVRHACRKEAIHSWISMAGYSITDLIIIEGNSKCAECESLNISHATSKYGAFLCSPCASKWAVYCELHATFTFFYLVMWL